MAEFVPDITVVVPCGGALDGIEAMVASLAGQQTQRSWEAVFVDNRLSDAARERLSLALAGFPRARIVSEPHRAGISPARNAGVAAARGSVIAFLDADDVAWPEWLEALSGPVEVGLIVAGRLDVERLNPPWLARLRDGPQDDVYICDGVFPVAPGGNMAIMRSDYHAVGGLATDVATLEDFDFGLRAWAYGLRVVRADPRGAIDYRLRTSPRALWRDGLAYGEARVSVYATLRRDGHVTGASFAGWRSWALAVALAMPALLPGSRRATFAWVAGNRMGRLLGSIRHRVVYL